jgi:hypothetical protein
MNQRSADGAWLERSGSAKGSEPNRFETGLPGDQNDDPSSSSSLPSSFGETNVMLVPVDPTTAHVYWDVSPADLKKSGSAQAVLRFYDIKGESFDGTNARGFFDVAIDLGAGSSYASLGSTEGSCQVDLGFMREDGRFVTLARSNTAQRPRSAPSTRREERSMLVTGGYDQVQLFPQGPMAAPGESSLDQATRRVDHSAGQEGEPGRLAEQPLHAEAREKEPGRFSSQSGPTATDPSGASTIRSKGSGHQQVQEADLTEWSETSFKSGLSSA